MKRLVLGAALLATGAGGGYWMGRQNALTLPVLDGPVPPASAASPEQPGRVPLYYQDPDGKFAYSAEPKTTEDGRPYRPVYDDPSPSAGSAAAAPAPVSQGKILFYRNPMGLPDTSPVPKKDSMGMDYIPVREGEATDAGTVTISPGRQQTLGVRTAAVEARPTLSRTVQGTGTVQLNERGFAVVNTKVDGWVEQLDVAATGEPVRRGQILAWIYSPDVVAAEQEFLVAMGMANRSHTVISHDDPAALSDAADRRLRAYDVPADEIARLRRTGQVSRRIAIRAPADGVVMDKPVTAGMHVGAGDPLYRTADLSTVWLVAQIQEADIGAVRPGEGVTATFVAFPGRTFQGKVDFIYPTLNAENRTARVRIVMPNPDGALRGDMYSTVSIQAPVSGGSGPMLVVPDNAVIDSGTKQVILVERGGGRFEPRPVHLGVRGDGFVQVLDGIAPDDRVVVGANFLIDAESNLRAALQAFMPPDGGTPTSGGKP